MKKKKQTAVKKEIQVLDWYNKYDSSWKGILVPESFAHPAKISFALSEAIYDFALEQGMIKSGDMVLDPFGGIAGTAFHAMLKGLKWVGVELEEKFVALGNQNITSWNKKYSKVIRNWGSATLVQGDSRKLRKVLQESDFAMVVSSSPFVDNLGNKPSVGLLKGSGGRMGASQKNDDYYGSTVGQLGAMKEGEFEIAVSSPPFTSSLPSGDTSSSFREKYPDAKTGGDWGQSYGTTDGQLGNLKEGSLDVAISSPPYSAARIGESAAQEQVGHNGNYGNEDGQLGKMQEGEIEAVIASPPYADAINPNGEGPGMAGNARQRQRIKDGAIGENAARSAHEGYGYSDGQLGAMKDAGFDLVTSQSGVEQYQVAVSSPPYEGAANTGKMTVVGARKAASVQNKKHFGGKLSPESEELQAQILLKNQSGLEYGNTEGQLGVETGDTFWSASKLIVEEVHALLKDNGTAFWVCKDFVRAKKIVPFCEQWMKLCESCGFETTHWIRAWQVKELGTQLALDGNHKTKRIERKSFFRRLAEKNNPSVRIDWEVVIVMRKIKQDGQ